MMKLTFKEIYRYQNFNFFKCHAKILINVLRNLAYMKKYCIFQLILQYVNNYFLKIFLINFK